MSTKPVAPRPTIKVSPETYNELYEAARIAGWELTANNILVEKGDSVARPVDYRLVAVRNQCLIEAVKLLAEEGNSIKLFGLADLMYQWVMTGKVGLADVMYQWVMTGKEPEQEQPKTKGEWK